MQAQLDDSRYQRKKAEVLDQTTSGQIHLLSSQIDQTSRTGKVRIHLQTPAQLTPGTPATAEILSGLKVGEQVVQKSGALISEGERVEPKNDGAAL